MKVVCKLATSPLSYARQLLTILDNDRDNSLLKIEAYLDGKQAFPYMPDLADAEYKMLAKRAVTNVMGFILSTSSQTLFVDQFRPGRESGVVVKPDAIAAVQPEWDHWQKSRLDARQAAVHRGALAYGHSFVVTEKTGKGVISKGLSALRTSAVFADPANDLTPLAALTITEFAGADPEKDLGRARMWDGEYEYEVTFKTMSDPDSVTVKKVKKHGALECPVTRFAPMVDLDGNAIGVIEPMFEIQDRLNQTIFDLLVVQSFASFKVRTVTGMAPPMKMKAVKDETTGEIIDWEVETDADGKPIPEDVNLTAKRMFWAEDQEVSFGTLDETPLDGFIKAIDLAFRHMAAISQTPPHHILGEIANLSAEALLAAETALNRKVAEFKGAFGESWEQVFRVSAQIGGHEGADDFAGEVLWRDMEQRSLAQAGDALGKLADSLEIPKRGLWPRIPGATATELAYWEDLRETDSPEVALGTSLRRAAGTPRPPALRALPSDPAVV